MAHASKLYGTRTISGRGHFDFKMATGGVRCSIDATGQIWKLCTGLRVFGCSVTMSEAVAHVKKSEEIRTNDHYILNVFNTLCITENTCI